MALRLVGEEAGGGAPTGASYVTTQAETGLTAEKVLGADVIMSGTLAARPAAATAGRLYFATDDAGGTLYRDTGSTWVKLAAGLTEVLADAVIPAGVMRDSEHATDTHAQALTGPITRLRTGTDAGKPGGGNTEGDVWWATDTNKLYVWDAAAWAQVHPSSGGAHQLSRVVRTAGDYSTTSTTFVDIDTTNLAITLTITANRWLRLVLQGVVRNNTANQLTAFDFTVGGTRQGQTSGIIMKDAGGGPEPEDWFHCEWLYQETTGGSITFRPQWKVTGGTANLRATTAQTPLLFYVEEIPV